MASARIINHFLRRRMQLLHSFPATSSYYFNLPHTIAQANWYSNDKSSSVANVERKQATNQIQVGFAEVVKENTKSAWYVSVILVGVGVTGLMFYTIFRELFSSKSPNNVYARSLERCMKDPKVVDTLGEPIKAFGEETRRGRRGHVSHTIYEKNGVPHLRMQFYIQGIRKRGTVHLEMRENQSGDYVYRYLFVQLEDLARTTILLEDNRAVETSDVGLEQGSVPRFV